MIEQRWDVLAKYTKCELLTRVDLTVVARIRGPDFSLWNRRSRCRRVGCTGAVAFQAKTHDMTWHEQLDAPWPDGRPPPSPKA
jgi:hypothetical protein